MATPSSLPSDSTKTPSEFKPTEGGCLCGDVAYRLTGYMGVFQYCHCSRCRTVSGSAFGANLFATHEQFEWLKGKENVVTYYPEDAKRFGTAFCQQCGSSMPWPPKIGSGMVVPVGGLKSHPGVYPSQNIFCDSSAGWFVDPSELPRHATVPSRKKTISDR